MGQHPGRSNPTWMQSLDLRGEEPEILQANYSNAKLPKFKLKYLKWSKFSIALKTKYDQP